MVVAAGVDTADDIKLNIANTIQVVIIIKPVFTGIIHRHFKFAGQVHEFWVKGAPLAQNLAPRARVDASILRHPSKGVAGDVADAVARGLNCSSCTVASLARMSGTRSRAGQLN